MGDISPTRVLILAHRTAATPRLLDAVRARAQSIPCAFTLLVPRPYTQVVCVDKKRQWSRWRNVWHSSAIRSTLYMLGGPGRALKRLFKRDRAVA